MPLPSKLVIHSTCTGNPPKNRFRRQGKRRCKIAPLGIWVSSSWPPRHANGNAPENARSNAHAVCLDSRECMARTDSEDFFVRKMKEGGGLQQGNSPSGDSRRGKYSLCSSSPQAGEELEHILRSNSSQILLAPKDLQLSLLAAGNAHRQCGKRKCIETGQIGGGPCLTSPVLTWTA
jgi:hypothetical protein